LANNFNRDTLLKIEINYNLQTGIIDFFRIGENNLKYPFHESITLSNTNPTCCIKNYKFNDASITLNEDDNDDILFTIINSPIGYISLHQLKLNEGIHYSLDHLLKTDLSEHLKKALEYTKVLDSIEKAQENKVRLEKATSKSIKKEKECIRNDLDTIKKELNEKKSSLKKSTVIADGVLLKTYKHKMDSVFYMNFNVYCPFAFEIDGTYKISVQLDHKILINSAPIPVSVMNKPYSSWFKTQIGSINNDLVNVLLENKIVQVLNIDSLISDIVYNHKKRCENYVVDIDANSKEFVNILDSVKNELHNFYDFVEVPTTYTYDYSFKSNRYNEKWICKNDNFTNKDIAPLYSSDPNFIKNQIHKKYATVKNGKYDVKLNQVEFNGTKYDPTIDSLHRYYKFTSYFGISTGFFLWNYNCALQNSTLQNNLMYWNLFYIRHHLGFFGGYIANDIINYSEWGLYVAPGNYFYFKVGFSYLDATSNSTLLYCNIGQHQSLGAVIGGSLIFPVVHFEAGYNSATGCSYIMCGLNIPFNQ
jgi:hypothetical protein